MLILILLSGISAPMSQKIISFIGQPEKAANCLHVWFLNCWGFRMQRHIHPKEDAKAPSDIFGTSLAHHRWFFSRLWTLSTLHSLLNGGRMRASLGPVLVSALFNVLVPVTMLRAKTTSERGFQTSLQTVILSLFQLQWSKGLALRE